RERNGNKAMYYRPPEDYILIPLKLQFDFGPGGPEAYYGTIFHEIAHASENRLGWLADPARSVKDRYVLPRHVRRSNQFHGSRILSPRMQKVAYHTFWHPNQAFHESQQPAPQCWLVGWQAGFVERALHVVVQILHRVQLR